MKFRITLFVLFLFNSFIIQGQIVTNTNDSGAGSLRQAILDANTNAGADNITFNIPGTGPFTIQPQSPLPEITDPVLIDGYTQPGAAPATASTVPILMIELDGTYAGTEWEASGLIISSGSSTVRGLVINRFHYDGIRLTTNGNNLIEGNLIGTDVTGTQDLGNGSSGIWSQRNGNTIGGINPESGNIISGNGGHGIQTSGTTVIKGNFIGTDITGVLPLGNGGPGIFLRSGANDCIIGGPEAGAENVISNNSTGIFINRSGFNPAPRRNIIQGNVIRTNTGSGISITQGDEHIIGGSDPSTGNVISHNGHYGVLVDGGTENAILSNSIFSNGRIGIDLADTSDNVTLNDVGDLDTGPNDFQNFPVLTLVSSDLTSTTIEGNLNSTPNTSFTIDFFANTSTDPSGYGEGETYLGETSLTTDSSGNAIISTTLPVVVLQGSFITSTATSSDGNTSEFSEGLSVCDTEPPEVPPAPADLTLQCADDLPSPVNLTATDNRDGDITVGPTTLITPGSCVNDFTMVRTWTFTDVCGNTSSVSQTITVEDTEAPVAPAAPADLTLQCADDVPVPINLTATDNCDGDITVGSTTQVIPTACLNHFTFVRTWVFTDVCGNSSSVSQTITVFDNVAPVAPAAPADLTLQCADDVPAPVNLTAVDNCDGDITESPIVQITPGPCPNEFTLVFTWTFTDQCGNSSSVSQTIEVKDDTAPVPPAPPADLTLQCADDVPPPVNLTAIDNCDGDITAIPTTTLTPGACANDFTFVRTWTFTDQCGNASSVSQTITVFDDIAPIITCPPDITVESEPGECVNLTVDIGLATATDNCLGPITITNNAPTEFSFGDTTVTWTAVDQCGNVSTCEQTVTVNKINTITTVTALPNPQQYSDLVNLEAIIDPGNCPGAGPAASKVQFKIRNQIVGTADLVLVGDNLVGNLNDVQLTEVPSQPSSGDMAPGAAVVTAEFQNINPNYNVADATTDLTITQENAFVDYTGQTLQATESSNSGDATVSLCVNVQDFDDGNRGDIRNATVTFINRDTNVEIAGPIPVTDLIFAGDSTLGTVCYDWTVDIGNLDSESFTIGIIVGGYYLLNKSEDNTVITVYKPEGDFITGGGYIIPDSSEGVYASDPGFKTNFGFNVKYNKKGTKVQGRVNIIIRRTESDGVHVYQIKSNAKPDFGVDIADPEELLAEFTSKANLVDITDPLNPVPLGGNLTLKVEMTDRGEPGVDDSVGINLTDSSGALLYSSNWIVTSTEEMTLAGGNIVVHSGFSTALPEANQGDQPIFSLSTDQNPFEGFGEVDLESDDKSSMVIYSVYDGNNKLIFTKMLPPDKKFSFGENVRSGMYIVKVQQGNQVDQIRMIKN